MTFFFYRRFNVRNMLSSYFANLDLIKIRNIRIFTFIYLMILIIIYIVIQTIFDITFAYSKREKPEPEGNTGR